VASRRIGPHRRVRLPYIVAEEKKSKRRLCSKLKVVPLEMGSG
jgi:hypothetical protein